MAIDVTQQALTLSDVKGVVITGVAQDESGEYVRELRIFGGDVLTPPILPVDAPPPGQGRLLLTVRLRSANRSRIQIAVPSLEF